MAGLSLLALALILVTCTSESRKAYPLRKVAVPEETLPSVKLSDWAGEIRILPLQTTENSLIDQINRLVITDEYILVSGSRIWLFDSTGKFLYQIGKKGDGPGEYASAYDAFLDEKAQTVEVLDRDRQRNLIYQLDGSFIRYWTTGIYALSFARKKELYYFYGGSEFNEDAYFRIIIKKDHKTIGRLLPFNPVQSKFLHLRETNNFNFVQDTLVFTHSFSDTVYTIKDKEIQPRYFIDFGKYQLPASLLQREYGNIAECLMDLRKTPYAFLLTRYTETPDYVYFSFERGGRRYQYLFDKTKDQGMVFERTEDDTFLHSGKLPLNIRTSYQEYLVTVMEAKTFRQKLDSLRADESKYRQSAKAYPVLATMVNELDYADNPVLLFIKPDMRQK